MRHEIVPQAPRVVACRPPAACRRPGAGRV